MYGLFHIYSLSRSPISSVPVSFSKVTPGATSHAGPTCTTQEGPGSSCGSLPTYLLVMTNIAIENGDVIRFNFLVVQWDLYPLVI